MSSQKRVTHSRASRASTATPIPIGLGMSAASAAAAAGRSTSPTSPTRTSRLQEKAELQHLNDRLACYIERMRNLENENSRLTQEVHSSHETSTREVSNIKAMFEKELAATRKLLDEVSREKAKLEIDSRRLWDENDEMNAKLTKRAKELAMAENSARVYEVRYNEVNNKYTTALTDRKKMQDEARENAQAIDRMRKQLDDIRKQLETETLARVDLENANQSLREELSFKDNVHTQELTETRSRRQVEISEIDGRLSEQYEAKLQQSLQELRDQYESQMRANRDEIELLYDTEVKNLQAAANRAAKSSVAAIEELRMNRTKVDNLQSSIMELEKTNSALNARIREIEKLLDNERAKHSQLIATLEAELLRMREEMAHQLQEYRDLMDIKVSLDLEIAAYDKLLCGEERRLNIASPSRVGGGGGAGGTADGAASSFVAGGGTAAFHRTRATPSRRPSTPAVGTGGSASGSGGGGGGAGPIKRRRTIVDESEDRSLADYTINANAKGDLHIVEADSEGRFIKLHNKGTDEINLTGWQLVRITAGDNEFAFKFTRATKIEGGASLTVWSTDAGVDHEPPQNIVMKKKWPIGDTIRSVLMNVDREEMAVHERIKSNISSHASRHRATGSAFTLGASSAGVRSLFSLLF